MLCLGFSGPSLVCRACERSLRPGDGRFAPIAAYLYEFPLDRLVQRFKFAGDLAVGRWLGHRLAERVRHHERPDVLAAPPLSAARLRQRGFNQAHELAKVVGRDLGLPVICRGLHRRRDTVPQSSLGRAQRRANLGGAFECRLDLRGRRVALVDDVFTTGATAEAFGEALRHAGAASVVTWVIARTPEPGE